MSKPAAGRVPGTGRFVLHSDEYFRAKWLSLPEVGDLQMSLLNIAQDSVFGLDTVWLSSGCRG
jgi:hypothetical protein